MMVRGRQTNGAGTSGSGDHRLRADMGGFLLVDMLVTAAIIIVLTVLYYGPSSKRVQAAKLEMCKRNLEFIHVACQTYAAENGGKFPAAKGARTSDVPLSLLVPRSTTSTEYFTCPSSGDGTLASAKPFAGKRISYAFAMGLSKDAPATQWLLADALLAPVTNAVGQPIFSSTGKKPANNHRDRGGNVMFADGHAERSPPKSSVAIEAPAGVVILNPQP